ncbi:MAG: hypothetical protein LPK28_00925, partial [Bacteroidota bacterium]|nr:hypothetical protein [Bacteroidota bacterium]
MLPKISQLPFPFGKNSLLGVFLSLAFMTYGQSGDITQYVIFGGDQNCPTGPGQTAPGSPGCGVDIGQQSTIISGAIGTYGTIVSGSNISISGALHAGTIIDLANGATLNGPVSVANSTGQTGSVFDAGSGSKINGNLNINGNITISSGQVGGSVTHPFGTSYSGPNPKGGEFIAPPLLANLPTLPTPAVFPAAGTQNINASATLTPGSYGSVSLGGDDTLHFKGAGTYVFNSINNSGSYNHFIFDFENGSGAIRIYIHGDVDLGKMETEYINGGSPSQIFTEVHGNGSSLSGFAFVLSPGSSGGGQYSQWLGTVYAPYAAIKVGAGSSSSRIIGALWSGTQVVINNGSVLEHAPFNCIYPVDVNAGQDGLITCSSPTFQLNGSSTTQNATFHWTTTGLGNIVSGANTPNPIVDGEGFYYLTVTSPSGCSANDTAFVLRDPCIIPAYDPLENGKSFDLIGSELTSLYRNGAQDSTDNIFILRNDSVWIEVISLDGQTANLKALLQTTPYGLTNIIENPSYPLIITGLYPIANLQKL